MAKGTPVWVLTFDLSTNGIALAEDERREIAAWAVVCDSASLFWAGILVTASRLGGGGAILLYLRLVAITALFR